MSVASQSPHSRWLGSADSGTSLWYSGSYFMVSQWTAIAICRSTFGFAIAADGRGRLRDSITGVYSPSREDAQKIFPFHGSGRILAYSVMGDAVASDDDSFSVIAEMEKQHTRLAGRRFDSLHDYLKSISRKTGLAYQAALRDSRLDYKPPAQVQNENEWLLAKVIVAGYIASKPSCAQMDFFCRSNNQVEPRISLMSLYPGQLALAAPGEIGHVIDTDPRFGEYKISVMRDASIAEAGIVARRRIEACATTLAAQIEPLCDAIGGHIHVAGVTPLEFVWLVPPKSAT